MSIKKWDHYFGISLNTLLGLSLLGVPRVILHDLSLIKEGSLTNSLFVFICVYSYYNMDRLYCLEKCKKTFSIISCHWLILWDLFSD